MPRTAAACRFVHNKALVLQDERYRAARRSSAIPTCARNQPRGPTANKPQGWPMPRFTPCN
ncbi:helix-turn-helix domain-containing protein [Paraburkholderia youngii]|uniref:helix-turn-helix domain-containing protein n=1 Tax=Paraburkholderia youngii TaxID=2782701 RepID=UPI003D1BFD3B